MRHTCIQTIYPAVKRNSPASAPFFLLALGSLPALLWLRLEQLFPWSLLPVLCVGMPHIGFMMWRARGRMSTPNLFWHFVAGVLALAPFVFESVLSITQVLITDAALRRLFTLG